MGNTNRPPSSVTDVRTLPWVLLVIVTVTPGSTAPDESCTVPETDALVVCPRRTAELPARTRERTAIVDSPPLSLPNFRPRDISLPPPSRFVLKLYPDFIFCSTFEQNTGD